MTSRDFSTSPGPIRRALIDLARGAGMPNAWLSLAIDDYRSRYRQTTLGPMWIVLQQAAWIGAIGIVFSGVFGSRDDAFFQYVAAGITVWTMISTSLTEAPALFVRARPLIEAWGLPLSVHLFRAATLQVVLTGHFLAVYGLIAAAAGFVMTWQALMVVPALALILTFNFAVSVIIAVISVRVKDLSPAVISAMALVFVLTPIFWRVGGASINSQWVQFNPFYHLVEVFRGPLIGEAVAMHHWTWAVALTLAALAASVVAFAVGRSRLPLWL